MSCFDRSGPSPIRRESLSHTVEAGSAGIERWLRTGITRPAPLCFATWGRTAGTCFETYSLSQHCPRAHWVI